jgi:hypothetical protein
MKKVKTFSKIIFLKRKIDFGILSEEKYNEYKTMLEYSGLNDDLVKSVVNELGYNRKSALSIGLASILNKETNKIKLMAILLVFFLAIYFSNKENNSN